MGPSVFQDQAANVTPPRVGFVIAQAVDGTSRGYDMTGLVPQDAEQNGAKAGKPNQVWYDLEAIGADIYFLFDVAAVGTNSIDDTSSSYNAAGTTWAASAATTSGYKNGFTAGSGATVFPPARIANGTIRSVRIDVAQDKTLIVKCVSGSTAVLRMTPSSQSMPGAVGV